MSDYDDDINQSAARPGMESVANRGAVSGGAGAGNMLKETMTRVSRDTKTGVETRTPVDPHPVAHDARDQDGTRQGPRRQVSPPTRSAFGSDSDSDPAPKAAPAAPVSTPPGPVHISGKIRTAQNLDAADDESK